MKKILVVESNRPVQGLSSSLFRRRECTLEVASSAKEALELARKSQPDLVVHDALVEDAPPEEFMEELNAGRDPGEEIPVMVVLPEDSESDEGALLRAGASAVVRRPADEVEMNVKVCELLGISLRRHLRTFVKMKVDATVGAATHFATISNISLGGVLIDTEKPIRLGEILKLSFFLPGDDDAITVFAKAVREENPGSPGPVKSYGCQFLDLSDSARKRIHDFVTSTEGDA